MFIWDTTSKSTSNNREGGMVFSEIQPFNEPPRSFDNTIQIPISLNK